MNPYTFEKAATLGDAVAARAKPETFLLAGGTDLIAQMKSGHRKPAHVVDVKTVPELAQVHARDNGGLEIGAAVSATRLAQNETIRKRHQGLHDSVQLIGSLQIQNRASIGGNICNAAPSADAVPSLIVDAAQARIAGPDGERHIALEDVFAGPGRTTLSDSELLVSILLPQPDARSASAYIRFTPRREMDIAVVGAAARISVDDGGKISSARVSLASVAPTPIRAPSAEAALLGASATKETFAAAAKAAEGDATPISDTRASADYRTHLIGVLVDRALVQCAARLKLEVSQ